MIQDKEKCTGCTACIHICPQGAICMEPDGEGFFYPRIDQNKCIHCHLCEIICTAGRIEYDCDGDAAPPAYAAYNLNSETQRNSSSGGLFREIAAYVIGNGGAVFGAAFTDDHMVAHIVVETLDALRQLQGSKYVQSDMNSCYLQARQMLADGRLVLFTGTPCQIAGLKSFLRRDYENLITQDIICHGVPSPMVWKQYLRQAAADAHSGISNVNFRDKKSGWNRYHVRIGLMNGQERRKEFGEDLYMKGFLQDIYLRPSCYQCSFKTIRRYSDFTLADFWGIGHVCDEMEHRDGTSLVWLNSEKAEQIWEKIRENLRYAQVDLKEAIRYNSAAVSSAAKPQSRERFFELIENHSFNDAVNAVLPKRSMLNRILNRLKKCLKMIYIHIVRS